MRDRPTRTMLRAGRLVIRFAVRDSRPGFADEIEGDLIELWQRRHAAGRTDLTRAYLRDLAGVAVARARRRTPQGHGWLRSSWKGLGMRQDFGYAVRMMRRHPVSSLAAVATLAIGIGAAAAIFTAVDRLLLRPLPYPDPDRILHVERAPLEVHPRHQVSPSFVDLPAITAAGTWSPGGANLEWTGGADRITAAVVDDGFFSVMGVSPLVGQPLPEPDGTGRYAVLAYDLWRARFNADRAIVGREISLNGRPFIVTGIMPPRFTFPGRTDVWVPPMVDLQFTGAAYAPEVIARAAPDAPLAHVEDQVAAYDRAHRPGTEEPMRITPLGRELTTPIRPTVILLAGCVALLLMVACASVSNVLLAQVAARRQEFVVRRALGATRWRVARLLLAEAMILSCAGAALGTLGAGWTLRSLGALAPATLGDLGFGALDPRLIGAAAAVSLLTAVGFGAGPGIAAAGHIAAHVVRAGRGEEGLPFWRRVRSGLIVGQMAVALVLLTASAAAVAALAKVTRIDPGFGSARALAMTVTLPHARFGSPEAIAAFYERAHERLAAAPGVRRVAATGYLPGSGAIGVGLELKVPGRELPPEAPRFFGSYMSASPDYFTTMGIRLVAGRAFTPADRLGAPPVIVLSETTARGLFPDRPHPVGQRVVVGRAGTATPHEIVGVVADVRLYSLVVRTERALRQAYVPLLQSPPFGNLAFVAEIEGRPEDSIPTMRDAMREVDASIPIFNAEPVDAAIDRYLASHRLAGSLVSAFALVTLLVAAIGLYGLMTQLVLDRKREIGIRIALGANPRRVRRRMLVQGVVHALAGAALGALGAVAALRLFASVAPAFEQPGPWVLLLSGGVLMTVAVLATWIPASRVIGIDPMSAIRE